MDEFQMHYAKWSKPDSEDFVMLLIWNPQKERATGAENRWAATSRGAGVPRRGRAMGSYVLTLVVIIHYITFGCENLQKNT